MPDNAHLVKPGDSSSKDINKQIDGAQGKDSIRVTQNTRLDRMLLVCLGYRVRKARESHVARSLPRNSEIVVKYNWMLHSLFQSGEITTETSFSELVKRQARSSTMARMLRFDHMLAKSAFEELMSKQHTDRVKRAKHEERGCSSITYARSTTNEGGDDEKEEGEI